MELCWLPFVSAVGHSVPRPLNLEASTTVAQGCDILLPPLPALGRSAGLPLATTDARALRSQRSRVRSEPPSSRQPPHGGAAPPAPILPRSPSSDHTGRSPPTREFGEDFGISWAAVSSSTDSGRGPLDHAGSRAEVCCEGVTVPKASRHQSRSQNDLPRSRVTRCRQRRVAGHLGLMSHRRRLPTGRASDATWGRPRSAGARGARDGRRHPRSRSAEGARRTERCGLAGRPRRRPLR